MTKSMLPGGDEDDRTIRLWDLSNGDELLCVEPQDTGLLSIAPFPDGRRCATTGKDGLVRIWEWRRESDRKTAVERK
jgi:WD40 repeat protein